jgi:hypothetical protein
VTNRVPVAAGDSVLCPARTPRAISAGILVVELQEPADLSIMLEWDSFGLGVQEATLGLLLEEALACVDRRACPPERLDALRGRPLNSAAGSLLPAEGDPFFVAERVDTRVIAHLSQSHGVLVVTAGAGLARVRERRLGADRPGQHGTDPARGRPLRAYWCHRRRSLPASRVTGSRALEGHPGSFGIKKNFKFPGRTGSSATARARQESREITRLRSKIN